MLHERRGGWNRYPDEIKDAVIEEVKKGDKTKKQVAEEYHISTATVFRWTGSKWREQEDRRARYYGTVTELHWEGWTYHAIARETGIPVQTVWDWINRPPGQGYRHR